MGDSRRILYYRTVLMSVQLRLGKLKASLEESRAQKAQLEGQLTHAETKVADLRERLEQKEVGIVT